LNYKKHMRTWVINVISTCLPNNKSRAFLCSSTFSLFPLFTSLFIKAIVKIIVVIKSLNFSNIIIHYNNNNNNNNNNIILPLFLNKCRFDFFDSSIS
ncbi:Unknown protein, partial [Striga hermonthica]